MRKILFIQTNYEADQKVMIEYALEAQKQSGSRLIGYFCLCATKKIERNGIIWDYGYTGIFKDLYYLIKPMRQGTKTLEKEFNKYVNCFMTRQRKGLDNAINQLS